MQGASLSIQYIPLNADHERASNTLVLDASGKVREHKRYADLPLNLKLAGKHLFPSRRQLLRHASLILMMIASLLMPLFTITAGSSISTAPQKKEVARQAAALSDGVTSDAAPSTSPSPARAAPPSASRGRAPPPEGRRPPGAGHSPWHAAAADLVAARQVLFVVSTFGEGEAPDSAPPSPS